MAVSGVMIVLAWVPGVALRNFGPISFDFAKGGEIAIWGILWVVLVYYAARFGADCWTDYRGWRDTYRGSLNVASGEIPPERVFNRHARRLDRKFWFWDVAIPALMFLAALIAAGQQVRALWN